jgi:hypothetical protein
VWARTPRSNRKILPNSEEPQRLAELVRACQRRLDPEIESEGGNSTAERVRTMLKRFVASGIVLGALIFSPLVRSQTAPPRSPAPTAPGFDGWGRPITAPAKVTKPTPAPRHDISGIWDPPNLSGNQTQGAQAVPEDGKPEHQLPYTPLGLEALKGTKPSNGIRSVLPADTNDPVFAFGDPQGFPREDLYELRTLQILQTPQSVVMLYQFGKVWRVIWTDGRELPKDPEPRWFGYSVGKWVDDYTFVVETTGTDERTWIDRAGRPHSADLRVEERFHRPDRDHLELSVTIDDPKMYTRPWVAMDKFRFEVQPPTFDIRETIWAPSEFGEYNKLIGNEASNKDDH